MSCSVFTELASHFVGKVRVRCLAPSRHISFQVPALLLNLPSFSIGQSLEALTFAFLASALSFKFYISSLGFAVVQKRIPQDADDKEGDKGKNETFVHRRQILSPQRLRTQKSGIPLRRIPLFHENKRPFSCFL
jgi:hypothetical protein